MSEEITKKYLYYKNLCREMEENLNSKLPAETQMVSLISPEKKISPKPSCGIQGKLGRVLNESSQGNAYDGSSENKHHQDSQQSVNSPAQRYDENHPLSVLKKLRKERESRHQNFLSKPKVSSRIRGTKRRQLPGWDCDRCSDYYIAAGLDEAAINKISRHRCSHKRVPSPTGYWDLDLSKYKRRETDSP